MDKPISFCVNQTSSEIQTSTDRIILTVIILFNAILAFPTTGLNALVIVSILRTPSLMTVSHILLMNLALTDFLMGLLGQPLQSGLAVSYYTKNDLRVYCMLVSLSSVIFVAAVTASIMTVTVIAVDRYLAIRLMIRYKSFVTINRVKRILLIIWLTSFWTGTLPFYSPKIPISIFGASGTVICLILIVTCYSLSFQSLRLFCAQVKQDNLQSNNRSGSHSSGINIEKYRRLLKTMLIVLIFIVFCYTLVGILLSLISLARQSRSLVWTISSLAGLNSTFNPLIYITRIKELRIACRKTFRRCLRCLGICSHTGSRNITQPN